MSFGTSKSSVSRARMGVTDIGNSVSSDLQRGSKDSMSAGQTEEKTKGDLMPSSQSEANSAAALPKIIPFETLARCGEEIWIENNGQIYRLRRTKQGKLILTK
jgi:hemin uptake protein HemP